MAEIYKKTYSDFLSVPEQKEFIIFLDNLLEVIQQQIKEQKNKKPLKKEIIHTQHTLQQVPVMMNNDRTIPLESIDRDELIRENKGDVGYPLLHYGAYANELTRSLNVLAFVIGRDVFLRNGVYKKETEEGRALIKHEVTHVQQHTEKRINKNSDKKQLEAEATRNEQKAYYDDDPVIEKDFLGTKIRLRKSKFQEFFYWVKRYLEEDVEKYCNDASDEDALNTLYRYKDFINSYEYKKIFEI